MLGLPRSAAPRQKALLAKPLAANGPREHYMRAQMTPDGLIANDRQDSALLSVLGLSDALLVRAPNDPPREIGETVDYIPI
jgi:molybdopterin molybdotransferase